MNADKDPIDAYEKLKADAEKLVAALERIVGTVEVWTDEHGLRRTTESDGSITARAALKEWRGDIEKK